MSLMLHTGYLIIAFYSEQSEAHKESSQPVNNLWKTLLGTSFDSRQDQKSGWIGNLTCFKTDLRGNFICPIPTTV